MIKYNLNSDIPGITIRLTPNPLKCETILTEAAEREIILRLAFESVIDSASSAEYSLENTTKENALADLRWPLKVWYDDTPNTRFEKYKKIIGEWDWVGSLNEQHSGDCISNACSCMRCYIDEIIGVNTFPFKQSYAYKLWDVYVNSSEALTEDKQLEEESKIRRAEFIKMYPHLKSDDKYISKFQSKRDADKKEAEEAYEEHKRLYAIQQKIISEMNRTFEPKPRD